MCCHVANPNKHPRSLRGHGICHNNSMISSKLRWFCRIPDLQTAWNKTCRQFSVYILICVHCYVDLLLHLSLKDLQNGGNKETRESPACYLSWCIGFWNGQWKDPGTDFQHPGFWGISELWWFQGGHQVTIPVASLPASLPVVHIGQGKDASIVPCSSLLLLPCHHPIWLHSQSQFLVATGRAGRYSPAAAFSGSINFRKKRPQTWNSKERIFPGIRLYW